MTRAAVTRLDPTQRRRRRPEGRGLAPTPTAPVQGTLALDFVPLLEPPGLDPSVPGNPAGDWIAVPVEFRQHLEQWARRHFRAAAEVVAGDRPVSQLARWCTPEVHQDLVRRSHLVGRAAGHVPGAGRGPEAIRPAIISSRLQVVAMDCFEASAHLRYGERSRAMAGRFEWRRNRWVNVALDFA